MPEVLQLVAQEAIFNFSLVFFIVQLLVPYDFLDEVLYPAQNLMDNHEKLKTYKGKPERVERLVPRVKKCPTCDHKGM